jgi:hypothetical protein
MYWKGSVYGPPLTDPFFYAPARLKVRPGDPPPGEGRHFGMHARAVLWMNRVKVSWQGN